MHGRAFDRVVERWPGESSANIHRSVSGGCHSTGYVHAGSGVRRTERGTPPARDEERGRSLDYLLSQMSVDSFAWEAFQFRRPSP